MNVGEEALALILRLQNDVTDLQSRLLSLELHSRPAPQPLAGYQPEANNALETYRINPERANDAVYVEWIVEDAMFPTITENLELLFLSITTTGSFLILRDLSTTYTISIPCPYRVLSLAQKFQHIFVLVEREGGADCHKYSNNLSYKRVLFSVPEGETTNIQMTMMDGMRLTTMNHVAAAAVLQNYNWQGDPTTQLRVNLVASPGVWCLDSDNVLLSCLNVPSSLHRCDKYEGPTNEFFTGETLRCVTTYNGDVYALVGKTSSQSAPKVLQIDGQGTIIDTYILPTNDVNIFGACTMSVRETLVAICCMRPDYPRSPQIIVCSI